MTTSKSDAEAHPGALIDSGHPARAQQRLWRAVAATIMAGIFAQAISAGALLSGADWAQAAHRGMAAALIVSALVAGVVAVITLRKVTHGTRFGMTLLTLAVLIFLQAAVGKSIAQGATLMWIHVPLGVALVGFAGLALTSARRLGTH